MSRPKNHIVVRAVTWEDDGGYRPSGVGDRVDAWAAFRPDSAKPMRLDRRAYSLRQEHAVKRAARAAYAEDVPLYIDGIDGHAQVFAGTDLVTIMGGSHVQ